MAFREGDGEAFAIGIRGLPSSFGAEAGTLLQLLLVTPHDKELTVLLDSLNVMQTLRKLLAKERDFSPLLHDHRAALQAILDILVARTAPTTLVKVKSHC